MNDLFKVVAPQDKKTEQETAEQAQLPRLKLMTMGSRYYLFTDKSSFASLEEVGLAIQHLQKMQSEMLNGVNYIEAVHLAYEKEVIRLSTSATWIFPDGNRVSILAPCVYFLQDPKDTTAIKIGFTTNLLQRLGEHRRKLGDGVRKMNVLAIAATPEYQHFERMLHVYFRAHRTERNEFFSTTAVIPFLDDARAKALASGKVFTGKRYVPNL